jgi:hypothetical protein
MRDEDIYLTANRSSTSFTSDIKTGLFAEEVQGYRPPKTLPPFLGRVSNVILAVAAFTSPQVYIPETPELRRSVSASVKWSLSRRGRRISLKRARELALQALAETERSLQRERHAEVALILDAWENNDFIEV